MTAFIFLSLLITHCLINTNIFSALMIFLYWHHNSGTFNPQQGRWALAISKVFITGLKQLIKFKMYVVATTEVVIRIIQ